MELLPSCAHDLEGEEAGTQRCQQILSHNENLGWVRMGVLIVGNEPLAVIGPSVPLGLLTSHRSLCLLTEHPTLSSSLNSLSLSSLLSFLSLLNPFPSLSSPSLNSSPGV